VGFFSAHPLKDRVPPVRILVAAMSVAGFGVLAFGGIITLPSLSAVAFMVGLGFFLGKIAVDTLIQQSLADAFRGRGFGLQDLVYNLSWILPALVLWATWDRLGARPLLVGAGLVFLATAAAIGLWARRIGARPEPAASPEIRPAD
jgi:hypothetical protein